MPHFPGAFVGEAVQSLRKQLIKCRVVCQVATLRSCQQQQRKWCTAAAGKVQAYVSGYQAVAK
jgi:hypothetical protein